MPANTAFGASAKPGEGMFSQIQSMFRGAKPAQKSSTMLQATKSDELHYRNNKNVSKSLVTPMTDAEKEEYNKLPSIEIEDLEQVHYLHTIAEGWAFPLKRFMNEAELLESMHMNTVTDENGEKHILSVPITHHITAE